MTTILYRGFATAPVVIWRVVLQLLSLCVVVAFYATAQQGFADVSQVSGIFSGWATSPLFPARGCVVSYDISAPGTSSFLSTLPCDTSRDAHFGLAGYQPVINLLQSSADHHLTYIVLADSTLARRPLILASFSSNNGSILSALVMDSSFDPVSLHTGAAGQLLYIIAHPVGQTSSLVVLAVNPFSSSWSSALISTVSVVFNSAILPLGASLLTRFTSAYLPISGQLVVVVGSALPYANSLYLSTSTTVWRMLLINPTTGAWSEVVPTDTSLLPSSTLTFTTLGHSDLLFISSLSAAWRFNVTARNLTLLQSFAQHLQRARVALGCGGLVDVAVDIVPVTIPSANSLAPFVAVTFYAQPALLSAVSEPFWYLLYIDTVRDLVTYGSIDAPPLFFNQIVPAPSVTTVTLAQGGPLEYDLSASSTPMLWKGSGFVATSTYSCVCPQAPIASKSVVAIWVNSSSLLCTLPPTCADLTSSTTWVPVQLVADTMFVLYASQLRVVQAQTGQQSVSSSTVPRSSIGRMVVSYSVASSLTPSPVVSSSFLSLSYASPTSATPLQLHSQLTRGLTFLAQRLQNLTVAPTVASQVLPSIHAVLTNPNSSTVIGLNDAYALFASASEIASADFTNMANSVVGLLEQSADSLPQLLTGLKAGSASTLALDLIGAQAQDWLTSHLSLDSANPTNLLAVLGLGTTLPPISSTTLSQLTSLSLNSVLQLVSTIPVLSDVLDDSTVSASLNLPNKLSSLVNDPVDTTIALLPSGALKDTVLSFLNAGENPVTFAGSLDDAVGNLFNNVGNSASKVIDKVGSLSATFLDVIAKDALDLKSANFAGPLSSLAGLLSNVLGADSEVQGVVTKAVSVIGGVAEIFFGNVGGGISSLISGLQGLFGGGSKGPDETQQLAQQVTADFNQVLGALSSLSNLTLTEYDSLQQQQLSFYQSEMISLSSIAESVGSVELSLGAAQVQLDVVVNQLVVVIDEVLLIRRQSLLQALEGWMGNVQTILVTGEQGSGQPRAVASSSLLTYQLNMNSICAFCTTQANVYAADPSMSGDPSFQTVGTYSAAINQQPNYDLSFALLPVIVSSYLSLSLPHSLVGAGNLPNPVAWAYAANFWMEARQAALQSLSPQDTTCLTNLWQSGQQMQVTVRLAVSQPTMQAVMDKMTLAASAALASFQAGVLSSYPTSVPSAVNVQSLVTALNVPGSTFAVFDDACAVASLLLTLAQATGLGSNGYTNGFVNTQPQAGTSGATGSFIPGSLSTQLIHFGAVTSMASFSSVLVSSANLSLAGSLTSTASAVSQQQQQLLQQACVLFNGTLVALENAMAALYPPCYVTAATAPRSLPILDTTLRRLAGLMMQTGTAFTMQGQAVVLPSPASLSLSVPVTEPLLSGSLCFLMYGLAGNVDYPWSAATTLDILYNPSLVSTSSGLAVMVISGSGVRAYTNRFGASFSTSLTISSSGSGLLYLNSRYPVDTNGLTLTLSSPVQLPGAGPSQLYSTIRIYNTSSGVIVESGSTSTDGTGEAFLSSVPGFSNTTIGASNVNSLAPIYSLCRGPIQFTNGLRQPTQPSASNGAVHFSYSYTISDGITYSVSTNLFITATSAFATAKDALGNPYQTITNITGSRVYTYVPTGATLSSRVTFNTSAAGSFYPYALLSAAPGVYTPNTAPYLDARGLTFIVSPSSSNGLPPGAGVLYTYCTVHIVTNTTTAITLLTELNYITPPVPSLQQQAYTLS